MKQKLFSIITPTYNCGRKIGKTIESVLSQPGELCEHIVVDNASTDDTLGVVSEYGRGPLRVVSEKDRGIYDALNRGIGMASGKYLYFLGAGDCLREGVLGRVAERLPGSGPSLVYGNVFLMKHGRYCGGEFQRSEFGNRNICHQSIFYERGVFDLLGVYDIRYRLFADWAFNMKCFADRRVRKVYVDLAIADFEEGGLSETRDDPEFVRDFPRLLRKYVGAGEYLNYRIYFTRVQLHFIRARLLGVLKPGGGAQADAPRGAGKRYWVR